MVLQSYLASAAIKAQNVIYRLSFPSIGDVVEGGSSAMEDGGTFSEASTKIDELGGGASNVTYKGIVWLFIIGFMGAAVALFFSNSGNRSDKKNDMIWKILAGACAFASVGLITFLATVGGGLFG